MLIEPDKQLAAIYRGLCESIGHQVIWAGHAQDAISLADDGAPDLVVLELQLASHNGVEFLYEFRSYAEWQRVPVILLTNVQPSVLRQHQEIMNSLGVVDYLYKPATTLVQLRRSINNQFAPLAA